jgi:hypothetical protein
MLTCFMNVKLRNRSRTKEKSSVLVYRVYSMGIDNILTWIRKILNAIQRGRFYIECLYMLLVGDCVEYWP